MLLDCQNMWRKKMIDEENGAFNKDKETEKWKMKYGLKGI